MRILHGEGSNNPRSYPTTGAFSPPKPPNLITVPCCTECRAGWSNDDEYFRLAVVSACNSADGDHAEKVNETVLRSLRKSEQLGFAKLIRKSLDKIEMQTRAGIYLGTTDALSIERARFDRVAERIIRGLFWHEKRHPVPEGYQVVNKFSQFSFAPFLKAIEPINFAAVRNIGNGVFRYTFATTEDDPDSSIWMSLFYDRLPFAGFTIKPLDLR